MTPVVTECLVRAGCGASDSVLRTQLLRLASRVWARCSARNDKRQPRFGKLELGGMNGPSCMRRGPRLQGPACCDLCLVDPIGKAAAARARGHTCRRPMRLQHNQPRPVHRLERQQDLEAALRRGLKLAGRPQRSGSIKVRTVTVKTQRTMSGPRLGEPTTGWTASCRPSPLELSALKDHPVVVTWRCARWIYCHMAAV